MKKFIYIIFLSIAIIAFSGCTELYIQQDIVDNNIEDFEFTWTTINEVYPFFNFKGIDWDSIYNFYLPKFHNINQIEKISLLGELLNELKDGHVNLHDMYGNILSSYDLPRSVKDENTFDFEVVKKYFEKKQLIDIEQVFQYETLKNNLGYVYIKSFPMDPSIYTKFDIVIEYLKNTYGLIIDIRHNGGGSTNSSCYFISRLISKKLKMFYIQLEKVN